MRQIWPVVCSLQIPCSRTVERLTFLNLNIRKAWGSGKEKVVFSMGLVISGHLCIHHISLLWFIFLMWVVSHQECSALYMNKKRGVCLGEFTSELATSGAREVIPHKRLRFFGFFFFFVFEKLILKEKNLPMMLSQNVSVFPETEKVLLPFSF